MIGVGLAWAARWSARLLLVAAGIWLLGFLVGALWTVVFPTLLAIVLATVFWPPAAYLRRHRFPPALASGVVVVVGILVIGVLISLVGSAVAGSLPQIVASVVTGVQSVRAWISGPPLNLADSQLTALVQQVTTRIQESVSTIAAGVLTGVGSIASGVITFVLVLILTFLFVKDGPKFLPWVHTVAGPERGRPPRGGAPPDLGHGRVVHPPAGRRQPRRRRAHRRSGSSSWACRWPSRWRCSPSSAASSRSSGRSWPVRSRCWSRW